MRRNGGSGFSNKGKNAMTDGRKKFNVKRNGKPSETDRTGLSKAGLRRIKKKNVYRGGAT